MLKNGKTRFGCLCFFIFISLITFQMRAEKRTLIVTVGEHLDKRWNSIHAKQDGEIIKEALIKGQHFSENNITVIDGEKATKANVVTAIKTLIKETKQGDIVIFFFSGHGQLVTDISGDEIDGWDKALVLYDTEYANDKKRTSAETHLIDDDLSIYLKELRQKSGKTGDVVFFIDACYSGGILRDDYCSSNNDRGGDEYIIPTQNLLKETTGKQFYTDYKSSENGPELSPYVFISACASHQRTREYNQHGALSLVLSQVLYENLSRMDYASFFEIIKARKYKLGKEYVLCETPQIEGNINRLMFAGKAIDIPKHFTINRILESGDSKDKTLIINAGELAGLTKGTELSFYPVMTSDTKNTSPLYACKIDTCSLLESVVKVPSSSKIDIDSWAFVSKYLFPLEKKKEYIASKLREAWTPDRSISLGIIPVSHSYDKEKQTFSQNNPEFVYSDTFEIKVTNTGTNSLYFLLINVLPDNEIKRFYFKSPNNDNQTGNYIEPGESKAGKRFRVGEGSPPGLETLMVIATDKPADFSEIGSRAGNDNFEDILDLILDADRSPYTIQNISIDKKNYIIKPK